MATSKRSTKKSDNTLVDIVEVRDQAQDFIDRNQNLVFGVLVAVILVVGGLFAYNHFYKQPRQQEAMQQMFQAQLQFQRDSFALALTNPGGGYLGFLDIAETYGGTKAGNLAHYYAGISYLQLGQFDAALDYLQDYKPAGQITPAMKYGALGDVYSEKGDFGQAMSHYQRAVNAEDNAVLTPYYLKKLGLLHEKQGDFDKAREAYTRIKEEYPESLVGRDIDKYIARAQRNS